MTRPGLLVVVLLGIGSELLAQQVPSPAEQIAAAVLPLPEALRSGAGVRGFSPTMERVTLRAASNSIVCSADRPGDAAFDVRCYNAEFLVVIDFSRSLYQGGLSDSAVEARIKAAIDSGRLNMPDQPTAGYRMLGPIAGYDARTNSASADIDKWQSVHFPYRCAEEVGFPISEEGTMPYVMASGTWWSHVMIVHAPGQ